MPSTETNILNALHGRLAALSLSPALPVAWPNVAFRHSGAYLRVKLMPGDTTPFAVSDSSGSSIFVGVYQIDAVYPESVGEVEPRETAGKIARHFRKGTKLYSGGTRVEILQEPSVADGLSEPGMFYVPVSVRYWASERPQ